MKIFTITNQKGGTGKTTTALELAASLTLKGHSVLSIDLDAQCNMSYTAGAKMDETTILGILTGEAGTEEAIQHTPIIGDIIPGNKSLAGADAFLTETGKEFRLKEGLEPVRGKYDYIVIDTPPALGILTINALTACNGVIIPAQPDIYSLQGIERLAETVQLVRRYCNPQLAIEGILLTRYSPRSVLSREVAELAEQMALKLKTKLFKTAIREAVSVKEAQISQKSLSHYAPKSKVAGDYRQFIEELIGAK